MLALRRLRIRLHFNSRPREGANVYGSADKQALEISIPAPARGRTQT